MNDLDEKLNDIPKGVFQQAVNAVVWIEGLIQTKHKQGRKSLGNPTKGMCCLGFGCHIFDVPYHPHQGASEQLTGVIGLQTDSGGSYNYQQPSCVSMNDTFRRSFSEIGNHLKKNHKNYFKPKVSAAIALIYKHKIGLTEDGTIDFSV